MPVTVDADQPDATGRADPAEAEVLRARIAALEAQLAIRDDILNHQSDWICRFRPDGTLTYANRAYASGLQSLPEELIGRTFFDFIPPDERLGAAAHLAGLGPERPVASYEHQVVLPDGQVRWDRWTDYAICDEQGRVVEFQSIGHNITERKLAEQQLTAQRDLAEALASVASLEAALPVCLDIALRIGFLDCGACYLFAPDGALSLAAARVGHEIQLTAAAVWPAHSDQARLVLAGRPWYGGAESIDATPCAGAYAPGLKALAVLPLSSQGRVIGCFALGSHTAEVVLLQSRSALEAIVAQAGQAIARVGFEAALRASQLAWETLFDTLQDFLFVLAHDGTILRVNRLVLQRLGYGEEELIGQPIQLLHPPELRAEAAEIIAEMVAGQRIVCPLELQTKDGRRIPVETRASLGRWNNRDVLFGVSRDISEHRRIERALRESETRLRTLVDIFPNWAVLLFDQELRYLVAAGGELRKRGFSSAQLEGRTLWEVLPPESAARLEPIYRSALVGSALGEAELVVHDSWYRFYTVPIRDLAGTTIAGLVIALNVTEQKRSQALIDEQTRAMATLRERERLARELHDSLGQMLAYLNVQAQAVRSYLIDGQLRQADAGLALLIRTVQQSQLEVREFILSARALRPSPLLPADVDSLMVALKRHLDWLREVFGFQTTLRLAEGLEITELTPFVEVQLLRIVQEALTNVRKHAGVGSAQVALRVEGERLLVEVHDEGRGFPLTHGEPARPEDTGFGLASMQERAYEIGAALSLVSSVTTGTTVTVEVPLQPRLSADAAEPRLLLVDDNPLFLQGLWQLLQSRGFTVLGAAPDGATAVEWARVFRPDIVLMDVEMPGMDGIAALRAILEELPTASVVMLTVAEDEATLVEAIKAGAAGYLLKSLDGEELCQQIHGLARGETALSAELALRVLRELTAQSSGERLTPADLTATLTAQQVKVLTLLAQGHTYKAIGVMLDYSERAIKYHTGDAIKKLQLQSRAAAIAFAREQIQRGTWPVGEG